jgi:hypothetical protein
VLRGVVERGVRGRADDQQHETFVLDRGQLLAGVERERCRQQADEDAEAEDRPAGGQQQVEQPAIARGQPLDGVADETGVGILAAPLGGGIGAHDR